ncbi:hypothetical protein NHX12_030416, partial [Muraenolepis orangiensis]
TRAALVHILADLKTEDFFGLITFNHGIHPWKRELVQANEHNVGIAKAFAQGIQDGGSTNINSAVLEGETNLERIQENVRKAIAKKFPLYCLGFGHDVNFEFLEKMALENNGAARRIYDDSDADLQLKGFYAEVATPLLTDVMMIYEGGANLTQTNFNQYYNGSEIVVVGQIMDNSIETFSPQVVAISLSLVSQPLCVTYGSRALLSVHPSSSAHPYLELSMPSLDQGVLIQRNAWKNLSVSLALVDRNKVLLLWNLSTPCRLDAQVKVKGMEYELGPFCIDNAVRGHVVVLSPPDSDSDSGVCELVCALGSFLREQGLGVTVDQWSRAELCSLGPLPWLYAQLLHLEQRGGGKVVLVLTCGAWQKAQEWTHLYGRPRQALTEDRAEGPPPTVTSSCPYSDVFSAALWCVAGDRQLGRARERFLLVDFESCPVQLACSGTRLPELLEGLRLFRLPSQNQAMLSELMDIDECGTELAQCPPSSYCSNTEGSYQCRDCDPSCVGCMGSGPARCRKCAAGYRLTGAKCLDIDECGEKTLPCPGREELCTNVEGAHESGLFEDIPEDEVAVLQQMVFGVVLCALATLAAKGDMVFTSIFMGGVAAMAGYWLSDRGDRFLDRYLKEG